MGRAALYMLFLFSVAGCGAIPAKNDTPMAAFNRLIVRDVNWKETAVSEIEGNDMTEYIASQPGLSKLFREVFGKYIGEVRYFNQVAYGDAIPDGDTLVLEPKIYTLKPCGFMPGATYTGLLKTADGRLLATYVAERRLNQQRCSNAKDNIEKLVTELAEDAASRLPYARR